MKTTFALLFILLAAAGCNREQPSAPDTALTPAQFMDVYVALRGAQATAKSAAEFEELKKSILQKANASPEDLSNFVKAHSGDVKLMAEVWDSIQNRINRQSITGHH